jgi:Flp pilus assembly pilin Flp
MIRNLFAQLFQDDQGQDLTEYSLLIAMVTFVAFALFATTGRTAAGVWNGAGTTLTSAGATAGGSGAPTVPPPSGGGE